MSFILNVHEMRDPAAAKAGFNAYYSYLNSVRESLPHEVFDFAASAWHYDPEDHRSPHDAWVESLLITEQSSGERQERRQIAIQLQLLGSYQDGHLELEYEDVQHYSISTPSLAGVERPLIGHGDWLIDEIRLSERKFVLHEIRFSTGANWVIECRNIKCQWKPLEQ